MQEDEIQKYFLDNFNTPLSKKEQTQYSSWLEQESKKRGRDLSLDQESYDMAGFWKDKIKTGEVKDTGDPESHFTDEYKKPNHPTFSNESKYNGSFVEPFNIKAEGAQWSEDGKEFTPSKTMLETTHPISFLNFYFNKYEKGVKLNLPKEVNAR